jgi:hypothetical protein
MKEPRLRKVFRKRWELEYPTAPKHNPWAMLSQHSRNAWELIAHMWEAAALAVPKRRETHK